ncbi:MAG: hypothetical protein JST42_15835 [Bacteroidetes bacterium]|nr:hypothetical protein [Bacteroidota bacterium]
MEEQQISPVSQDLDNFFNITFDTATRRILRQAAVWAKVATICAFSGYGVTLIIAFVGRPQYTLQSDGSFVTTRATGAGIFSAIITVAVGSFINYFLYRFAVAAIRGVDAMDSVRANEGFNNLRTYFKILGICIIIGLCFLALAVLVFFAGMGSSVRY